MRVPLDFYRILGVPHQATPDQLHQAYSDRMQQLPQYHYSDGTIAGRRELLEAAYTVLSDPQQRRDYDANFLAKVYTPNPLVDPLPSEFAEAEVGGVDIQDHQLAGALLLLQELGEYELVLKLGRPYLSSGILELKYSRLGSVLSEADIVLSVALAYLELGREQWQQNQYEKAAESLKHGLNLLLREGLFSDVQSEIRTDLYKLRPYRILELLALPEDKEQERNQGLGLLKDVLTERGGIDGTGNDQSGLGIDDFLQFIQQLRHHLSLTEQKDLFETEAQRPSAVAIYLAVYTLLAQGFTQCQPALIRRARAMLAHLSSHQDIHLEEAACALLLGQTQEASQALELSHEYESIAFIRDYSEGSPDLIPGLCLYTERWLQDEVFPYFRDLADQTADLKTYFANQHVQTYLEALAAETPYSPTGVDQAVVRPASTMPTPPGVVVNQVSPSSSINQQTPQTRLDPVRPPTTAHLRSQTQPARPEASPNPEIYRSSPTNSSQGLDDSSLHSRSSLSPSPAERVPQPREADKRRPRSRGPQNTPYNGAPLGVQGQPNSGNRQRRSLNEDARHRPQARQRRSPRSAKSRSALRRQRQAQIAGLILLSLLGIGVAAVAVSLIRRSQPPVPSAEVQEQPLVQLERPPLPIPTSGSQLPSEIGPNPPSLPMTKETVKQLVQTWQATKAEALGSKHASNKLGQVLAEPALSQWQTRAEASQANEQYWQYKLNRLSVDQLEPIGSDQANAKVTINETADLFKQGRPQPTSSYSNTYQVRYNLVRQEGRWLIRAMEVL